MTTNTDAKLAAKRPRKMAREPQAQAGKPPAAKRQTKIDIVLGLLSRAEGATIGQLVSATGWLPHTTRAALTGLKKKGHTVGSTKIDRTRLYRIDGTAS